MNLPKLNYWKARQYYEKKNKKYVVDMIIDSYLRNEKNMENAHLSDEFLKGVVLHPTVASLITDPVALISLIVNGAEPRDILIESAKKSENFDVELFLCQMRIVDISYIEQRIIEEEDMDAVCDYLDKIFRTLDENLYVKMHHEFMASCIANTIQDGCKKCTRSLDTRDFIKNHIGVILNVLANSYSHNEDIQVIVTAISRNMFPEINRKIVEFYGVTFDKMESTQIPKYLYEHPALADILGTVREQSEEVYVSCFGEVGEYERILQIVSTLTEEIKKGGFRYTGYALRFFKEIYAKRLEIVNAWLENGCEAELDVYGASLISGDGVCEKDDISYFSHLDGNMDPKEFSLNPSGE